MRENFWNLGLALTCAFALAGCASVTEGTTQKLTVNSIPQGATCVLSRDGAEIAKVAPTPGTVEISKSRHDIDVSCTKPGYPSGGGRLNSDLAGMTFGNLILGGLVGVAIDAGTGAMNKYDPEITVPLDPNARPVKPVKPEQDRVRPDGPPSV